MGDVSNVRRFCRVRARYDRGARQLRAGEGEGQWRQARGNRKGHKRSADEKRLGMSRAELERRILRLRKQDMGLVKIGRTLGVGTSVVQRVLAAAPA